MSRFLGMFIALQSFLRHNTFDENGIKVIIEVDGEIQAERFAHEVHAEAFITQRAGISQSRTGTVMGIPFLIRTSPRCSKCHK
jgi:hypothetical protein